MRHSRVCHHPLDIGRGEGDEISDYHRQDSECYDRTRPEVVEATEGGQEDAEEGGEGRRLDRCCHEPGHGRWCPLIGIWCPHMEWDRCDLEAEADSEERHPSEEEPIRAEAIDPDHLADQSEVRTLRATVDECDTEEEEGAREGTEEEVLECPLCGAPIPPVDPGQYVDGHREEFECDEDHHSVSLSCEDRHPDCRQEGECVDLTVLHPRDPKVPVS